MSPTRPLAGQAQHGARRKTFGIMRSFDDSNTNNTEEEMPSANTDGKVQYMPYIQDTKHNPQVPVSMVEPLDEPGTIGQSNLNVGERLGGVKGHGGAGFSLICGLVLRGGSCR